MVNAHPTLLYQICVVRGCQDKVPHLHVLVEDRDTLLKHFMDKKMKERVAAPLFTYPGKCNRHFKPLCRHDRPLQAGKGAPLRHRRYWRRRCAKEYSYNPIL
jgi:hypothetical protein